MQVALDDLYPYAPQPFATSWEENSNIPKSDLLQQSWEADIRPTLADSNLNIPEVEDSLVQSREEHTSYLSELVEEMQMVARTETGAQW